VVTLEAIGLVDFSKPDLECMFSADQVAADSIEDLKSIRVRPISKNHYLRCLI